jgi:hypothetical protein
MENTEKFLDILDIEDGLLLDNHISQIYKRNILEGLEIENYILQELTSKKFVNIEIEGLHYHITRLQRILDIDEAIVYFRVEVVLLNNYN